MSKPKGNIDLDDLLDDALDDLADSEGPPAASSPSTSGDTSRSLHDKIKQAAERSHTAAEESLSKVKQEQEETKSSATNNPFGMNFSEDEMQKTMAQFMEEMKNPDFAKDMESMFKAMNIDPNEFPGGGNPAEGNSEAQKILQGLTDNKEFEEMVKSLSQTAGNMEGADPASMDQMSEKMMQEMLQQFEKMGQKQDFQKQIDAMMRQVVSKEIMYDPVKAVCDRFPAWLAEKEKTLPKEEYEKYGKQYQYFQQLLLTYDNDPDNFERLIQLMQEMQECGSPPREILDDIAPGMDFANPMAQFMTSPDGQKPGCPQM